MAFLLIQVGYEFMLQSDEIMRDLNLICYKEYVVYVAADYKQTEEVYEQTEEVYRQTSVRPKKEVPDSVRFDCIYEEDRYIGFPSTRNIYEEAKFGGYRTGIMVYTEYPNRSTKLIKRIADYLRQVGHPCIRYKYSTKILHLVHKNILVTRIGGWI